jgi:SecD/SecF fusion protein
MRTLFSRICLVFAVLALCAYFINPPEKQLRLGKDLRGGVSLVYSVLLKPGDNADTISKVIDSLKQRVDPNGLSEIAIVEQGGNRIEVTMPLPNERVKRLRKAFEEELQKFTALTLEPDAFEQMMRLQGDEREKQIEKYAAGLPTRSQTLHEAASAADAIAATRAQLSAAQKELDAAKAANADPAKIVELDKQVNDTVGRTADLELKYEDARKKALAAALTSDVVRRAILLPNEARQLTSRTTKQLKTFPSPREQALSDLKKEHPDQAGQIDKALQAYLAFVGERTLLDDPADLERLLSGAGVLDFRITVNPGKDLKPAEEDRYRREFRERGPKNAQTTDARWYQVHNIDTWYDTVEDYELLRAAPEQFFFNRGFIGGGRDGEYYILGWDVPGSRLTRGEGEWAVSKSFETQDQLGRPAIGFEMDIRGAGLLGEMTKKHVGDKMAVMLDDKIYTAPNLNSAISNRGIIEGNFSQAERTYVIRVLGAGSLQAKLSPEPISRSTLGPELGADNLQKGLHAGLVAFIAVSVFMCVYYFPALGGIAVFALWCNLLMILGIMALQRAAFTLPGIAGVVLTFGQAVDANVLVYERMREEFRRGHDMRSAVRLGFSKAFSSIVDGNVSNLIICAVLYQVGSQEIKGFAITLAIGVLATLFGTLVVSRLLFTIFVEHLGWRRTSMLPMAIPHFQNFLTPKIDWIRLRWVWIIVSGSLVGMGLVLAIVRGPVMLDTAFRGGTQIELTLRTDPATGKPVELKRQDIEDRIKKIATSAAPGDSLRSLSESEILPINPRDDGVTSNRFEIKTFKIDEREVSEAITREFADVIESRPALGFAGRGEADVKRAPVYKVLSNVLGENIDRPEYRDDVSAFFGGVAIVLERIDPPVDKKSIELRLNETRQHKDFADTLARRREVRVIGGTPDAVKSAVVLVRDDSVSSFEGEERWSFEVASREWRLVNRALGEASQLANVQSFSATIASTFKAQAVVAITLSLLLLTIYVWVRFGAARWAIAATLPLFHDILSIIGLIALAQIIFEHAPGLAHTLGILPFKIDLNLVAAMLTIAGYSLNDTIIILDRIRENKGKMTYASAHQINDSINQTFSRTLITSGTTLISTSILYLVGGEAVRGFAYAFTLGVFIGTYSSIAISAPLVWSRKSDRAEADAERRGQALASAPASV